MFGDTLHELCPCASYFLSSKIDDKDNTLILSIEFVNLCLYFIMQAAEISINLFAVPIGLKFK